MNRKELKNVRKMRGLGNKSASGYGILLISALLLLFFITLTFASQDFGISMDEEYYLGEDIYVIISGPSDAVFDVRVINPEGAIVFSDRKQTNNNGLSYIHMSGFTKPGAYTITLDLEGAILMEQFMVSDLSQTTTTITTTTTTTATTTTRTTTAQAPASTSTATTTVPTLTATSTSTTTETSTTISSTTHPEPSAIVVSVEFENDTVSYTESINHSNETNDTLIDPLKLITLEKHFRANEEPEFEIGDKVGGVGILGVTETPEARIEDFHGNIADVKPLIQEAGNKFKVTVPKERKVKPGLYKLVVESESNKEEIWFTWGLVTVNTRKSLYHPGEEAEILMVVLDKDGHLVSGARIHLQVTSPSGNETLYSNPKTIKELRNGIYRVFHETDEEGNYSLSVTAEAAGVIAYMNSYFTVKDFYEFDILRKTPLVIDPRKEIMESSIQVSPHINVSSPTLNEYLPSAFEVVECGNASVTVRGDTTVLTWNLTSNSTVSYKVRIPLLWPYLYELGPAEISYDSGVFREARPWYLAVDPAPVQIFHETFPNADGAWGGSSDTAQDEPGWVTIQDTTTPDANDVQVSNEDVAAGTVPPSGGNHLTFEDCDVGGPPITQDLAYVPINLSGYVNVTIRYYWQSDDVDANEGMQVHYSTDSTNGVNGAWTLIAQYINPLDDTWNQQTYKLPDSACVENFTLRFASRSSLPNEHMYIDDVNLTGDHRPVVDEPATLDSSPTKKSTFRINETVTIRVNVTDEDGATDISTVMVTITNPQSTVKVNNQSMTQTTPITNGYVYEYNYTILVESDSSGSWTIHVFANDTMNVYGKNTTTFKAHPIVKTDKSGYIVNETVSIKGYAWNPNSDITLSLRNPNNDYVNGYPKNVSSDASGNITDTWGIPVNSLGGTYTLLAFNPANSTINDTTYFNVTALTVETNKPDYVRAETVYITGDGFASNVNVTVVIYDLTMDPVNLSLYPKNVTSNSTGEINDSWIIPAGQSLGTYTVNATENTNSNRSTTTTFDIVSAIIQADKPGYEQGETVNISGYNWDNNVDVTINITGPGGALVYGPLNRSSNGSGWINDSWFIDYNRTLGNYTIYAFEPLTPSKNDDFVFTVTQRPVSVETDYLWYKRQETVNITGAGFSPNNNVTIDIRNSSGQSVSGYPKNLSSNSTGGVNETWTIPLGQKFDNYRVNASDNVYGNLQNTTTFEVVVQQIQTDKSAYKSGETVHITGSYWDRNTNVTLDIKNSTGQSASGYPKNVSTLADGTLSETWTAQPGAGFGAETYNLTAKQATDFSENDSTSFDVTKAATLYTDQDEYYQNSTVNLTGGFYNPNGDVKIWIISLGNNGTAKGYPKIIQADNRGDIEHIWNTSLFCEGSYLVKTEDQTYPNQLKANTTFSINYSMLPFGNFGFEGNNWDGWTWSQNSYFTNGEDCKVSEYASDGKRIVSSAIGDWELDGGSYTGGGGEQADALDGSDSDGNGYTGMLTSQTFTIPKSAINITFWIHSDYRSADANQCFGAGDGNRFEGTANETANDWGEGCIFALWVSAGAAGRTDDYYIWEKHASRESASAGCNAGANPNCPAQNISVNVTAYREMDLYLTGECIGRGGIDDALFQMDGVGYVFPEAESCMNFDVTPPTVKNITATPDPQKLGKKVNITANVSDANNISYVKAIFDTPNGQQNLTMTDSNSDGIYNCTFTSTTTVGLYNVTIWANDTWSNVNATEKINFTIEYDTLAVETDKPGYILLETVYLTGTGFSANVNVTIDIHNSTGQSVTSYPKNISSNSTGGVNDSWTIPGGQSLGTYTVNATDTTALERSTTTTFDIVTAIIQSDKSTYEQGGTVYITGYNWDNNVNVTINITGPDGALVYGPLNRSSNGSGWINDSWFIGYNATLGDNYTIYAFEPGNPSKNDDYVFEVVQRPVVLSTEYSWYKRQETVNISGAGFSPLNNVTIDIRNSSGQSVSGYPKNVSSNSSGGITDSWSIPAGQLLDNYTINASDCTYSNLFNSTTFEVVVQQIQTDKSAYKSGETVHITGSYWDRNTNVTLDIKNSTGQSASGYPKNVSTLADGTLSETWTAQPGAGFGAETYNLTAKQATDFSENDSTSFDVTKAATLQTDKPEYVQNEIINITGGFYTPNGDVKLWITCLDNSGTALDYPKIIQANPSGDIQHLWNTTNICGGNFSVESVDQSYPAQLYANTTFRINYEIMPFDNFGFEDNNWVNWTWSPNSYETSAQDCRDAYYASDGYKIVSSNIGDWELGVGSYTGGGGEQEYTLDGGDDVGTGYHGMLTSSVFTVPMNAINITFWIHSDYRSADNGQCSGAGDGNIFNGTLNETGAWSEGCIFAVWVEDGAVGLADNYYIWEKHATRESASAGCNAGADPNCPAQNISLNVTLYRGQKLYLTAECIGWGGADDALFQMDGIGYDYEEADNCSYFDVIPPNVTNIQPSAGNSFNLSDMVNITANVSDNNNVNYVKAVIDYPNGTQQNLTMTDPDSDDVYNCTFTDTNDIGRYNITVWANDSWRNINDTETSFFYVNDTIAPNWSGNATSPAPPVVYSPTQSYQFNVSWTDNYELDTVWIEHDFNGSLHNHSITGNNSEVFYYNYPSLSAGSYVWRMYANDTSKNLNHTPHWSYIVQKNTSVLKLTLDGFEANTTVEVYSIVKIIANLTNPEGNYIELYQNGSLINNGSSPLINNTNFTSLGLFNISAKYLGDENYTNASKTYWVTVQDTTHPSVKNLTPSPGTKYNTSDTVTITANVSDNYFIDSVRADITWASGNQILELNDSDSDNVYEVNFTSTSTPGRYNVTILVNDSSNNLNDTETTYFIVLETPSADTDKENYIVGETVYVTGKGFNLLVNVSVDIRNSTGQSISGVYPKNISSNSTGGINDSWLIPGGQALGTYTVNATDTSAPERSTTTSFDIVTAIIQADKSSYEQGETVNISGYNWDNNVDVTINITGPGGALVYGPLNRSSNGSGWINDSWFIDYNRTLGNYTIYAFEPGNENKSDDYTFKVIQRPVSLATEYVWYKRQETVNISGAGFSPNNNVTIDVYNSTGQSVSGYPKNVFSNSTGGITDSWSIPAGQLLDNYTINASDYAYPNLCNTTSIQLVIQQIQTDKSAYKSGETVHITGSYWDRNTNVTLDIKNSTGQSASGYPKNVSTLADGTLSETWTAQPGAGFGAEAYNLTAKQATNFSENSTTSFDVTKVATLQTDRGEYDQDEVVNITGSFYAPSGDVEIRIINTDTGGVVHLYPKIIQSDSQGDIEHLWNASDLCEGNYSLEAVDQTYPDQLYANNTFGVFFYEDNSSIELADSGALTGGYNLDGGSYTDTQSSNNVFHYFGAYNTGTTFQAWVNYSLNLSALNLELDRIGAMNFTLEYCHSGNQVSPKCDEGHQHEGTTYGDQDVELWNYSSSSWIDIGNIDVNDTNDTEHTGSWLINSGFTDFVSGDMLFIRFEASFNQSGSDDDALVIDYLGLNVAYQYNVSRSCTGFPTTYLNLTNYNGSYIVDYGINISVINSSGQVIDSDTGSYYRYLYNETYDVKIISETDNGTLTAIIRNLSLTSSITTISQVTEYYLGELPFGNVSDLTTLFALNDDSINYEKAELYLPRRNLNISYIAHCSSWDYSNANCSSWEINETADYNMQQNTTHIWFNVTGFDSFGGGQGKPLPNITEIRIYDVSGQASTHSGGSLVDSGLNTTFILYKREPKVYRVELDVRNDGKTQWTIDSTDLVYHENLNSSWQINESGDIWYFEGAANYTGGNWSNGRVTWNTSQGGKLTNGETGTFYYVVNVTTSGNEKYPVYFLANDTVNNAGSYDNSVYNITRVGYLEIQLVTPPVIPGQGNASQNGGYKVGQNKTFIVNATVYCRDGVCGDVNGTLMYNQSSAEPDVGINTSTATPFYILTADNPQNCSTNPLVKDEFCNLTWTVNSTGVLNSIWALDILFNSTYAQGNDTGNIFIEITKVLIMSLSWSSLDFGFCDPGTFGNNASLNNVDGYNITVDNNSNTIDEILVKGTDLSADSVGSLKGITYEIGVRNLSWNDDLNQYNHANTTRMNLTYVLMRENVCPGTKFHNYYWLDVPSGKYSQHYSGTLYVLANASTG